jgi:hypothetical protein
VTCICTYAHKDAIKFLTALKKKYKPRLGSVSVGDLVDFSIRCLFHSKHPDLASPGEELALIRQQVLRELEKLFPKMIITQVQTMMIYLSED